MSGPIDILALGAHPPALRGLREMLGESLDGWLGNFRVTAKTVGVGIGVAGAATAKRVVQLAPRVVVWLGTCGIYPGLKAYQPEDIVVAKRFVLYDHAVAAGRAAFPDPMQTSLDAPAALAAGFGAIGARTHLAPVASVTAETRDEALGRDVHTKTGAEAESLEAFVIAHACQLLATPFAALLGVTHVTGPQAVNDFRRFERGASLATAGLLRAWIQQGAPGMPHK